MLKTEYWFVGHT